MPRYGFHRAGVWHKGQICIYRSIANTNVGADVPQLAPTVWRICDLKQNDKLNFADAVCSL